ncbi:hemerythrin [Amphritea atlantica]|uniref:diguanylate cyclase n=1 Tax=Amphritea atlantica TaxID=355243 RepID=A0A1H9KYV8_9GAMM|nr:GGDEF domain-containing protein [Amphritea atlantica]SER04258.1 hemerythrin [Amphritea atlantica]
MESFHWDQGFLTGIADIDDQHHHLVDVINSFGELISGREAPNYSDVEALFSELTEYTHYHFSEEEAFMDAADLDPRYLIPHKESHQHFINEVEKMRTSITPATMDRCEKVMKFLVHWLAYHILGTDKSMARQISQIEAGVSPADAFEQEQQHQESSTGPLLAALTGLFQQVSERNHELYKLNQTLEQRVEERTRELENANHKLEVIALTDALTGLPNRRHALQAFEQLWGESDKNNSPLCCMMIDADYFKQINDTYGHDAGDEVLRQLSHTLKNAVRNDDITARLGGDEFLIICPNTDLKGGLQVAEKMSLAVNALRVPAGKEGEWKGSVSVGISSRTPEMAGPDDLIKAADNGVYLAKQSGRNCIRTAQPSL